MDAVEDALKDRSWPRLAGQRPWMEQELATGVGRGMEQGLAYFADLEDHWEPNADGYLGSYMLQDADSLAQDRVMLLCVLVLVSVREFCAPACC